MEFDPRWPTTYGAKDFLYERWWARKGHLVPIKKLKTKKDENPIEANDKIAR